jgi:hypothetical protein
MSERRETLGALGHFLTPEEAVAAAEKVRDSRYTRFDFLTPFPIHEMEAAMGQKRSWVPLFTVAFVVIGILTAQAMMNYIMVIDWPMNYGGKPFFAWPSFIPITFELMVLFGGIGTAVVAILGGKKDTVPQPPPMLIKSGATGDRFVLWISATDPNFSVRETAEFLKDLNALDIRVVDSEGHDVDA